jgi:hypothetical protein
VIYGDLIAVGWNEENVTVHMFRGEGFCSEGVKLFVRHYNKIFLLFGLFYIFCGLYTATDLQFPYGKCV